MASLAEQSSRLDAVIVVDSPIWREVLAERIRSACPQVRFTVLSDPEVAAFHLESVGATVAILDYTGDGARVRELLAELGPRSRPARPYVMVFCRAEAAEDLFDLLAGGADDLLVDPCSDAEFAARLRAGIARVRAVQSALARAEELEELSSRQTDFLSVVSHEIRTPLAAILSAANILVRYGKQRPESIERFGRIIQEEGRRLTRLINNLLDLTKIEAGKVEWEAAAVPLAELANRAEDAFAALVGERSVGLEVTIEEGVPELVADRDKLMQVLVNLISNAVKHSPEGSRVYVRGRRTDNSRVRLEVEDEGSGIPAGAEERIFQRFQQLDVEDRNRGTGLGLTISRHIVARHGGQIWAEPGCRRGALFVVELPVNGLTGSGHGPVR